MNVLTYHDPAKENWFLVSWTLGNKCNYRCSYCPTFLHDGSAGWPDWTSVKDFVINFKKPGKEICYRISGGEPTYWKHFLAFAQLVKEQGHIFSYLTNGSQSVEYYQRLSEYTDGMILTYHPEYTKIDHFVDILKNVPGLKGVNVMITPENFDSMLAVAEILYNASDSVAIWPKVVLDKTSNPDTLTNIPTDYTDDQLKIIKEWPYFRKLDDHMLHRGNIILDGILVTANDLLLEKKNRFQGWQCWGGLHMISIDKWGDIYRADCTVGGKLGNLSKYQLPTASVTCTFEKCSCLSDIYLKKVIPIQTVN